MKRKLILMKKHISILQEFVHIYVFTPLHPSHVVTQRPLLDT